MTDPSDETPAEGALTEEYNADAAAPAMMEEGGLGEEPSFASQLPSIGGGESGPPRLDTIMRIPVTVRVVLGSATMPVANLMKLGRGSVIPLERKVGEPVEVAVNGHTVARGQVVVMDEATSRFGIKLTEVLTQSPISDVAS
ncbi:MAG: flagellar motor switch protein FliN [Hyphomicrobiaceae bacterium]|nr:flagellar motor switch protein FliN [Hyphomicrobiaceae bacterium]